MAHESTPPEEFDTNTCPLHRRKETRHTHIGLRKPGDPQVPDCMISRHHFAIQTMLHWYSTKADVETHLPELSTYLGHVHPRDASLVS